VGSKFKVQGAGVFVQILYEFSNLVVKQELGEEKNRVEIHGPTPHL
jgi:hypothetical protein